LPLKLNEINWGTRSKKRRIKMKKLFAGLVLFLGVQLSVQAEDFPLVEILGSSPNAEFISTIQTLVTDGKGDMIVEINVYDSWGTSVYRFETAQECLNDDCVEAAKQEALDMNTSKLQKFNIDTNLTGTALFTYARAERQVDETYSFPTQIEVSADGFEAIALSYKVAGEGEYQYNQLSFKKDSSSEASELYVSNFEADYPKVGAERVVHFKGTEGKSRILVVSATQSHGFEGPNTNFQFSFFDL